MMHRSLLFIVVIPTLSLALTSSDPVKINEVYMSGVPGITGDAFVELYNAGSDTIYLDGAMLIQGLDTLGQLAFAFPGEFGGTAIPLAPSSYMVIAADAHDFSATNSNSVNLMNANFETFSPFEAVPLDNPDVPDLIDRLAIPFDWFFEPDWGQVILATGESWALRQCEPGQTCGDIACIVPLETVVDGMEYYYENGPQWHILRDEIDQGSVVGIPPRSGYSAERIVPGHDTNNSTYDFVIRPHPAPGYQGVLNSDTPSSSVIPSTPAITDIFPNPFNRSARIRFEVAHDGFADVTIFNILGQPSRVLVQGNIGSGAHEVVWDGLDNSGQPSPSGIYFVKLETQGNSAVSRVALAR